MSMSGFRRQVDLVLVVESPSDTRSDKNLKDELCRLGHALFNDNERAYTLDLRLGLVSHDVEGRPAVQCRDFVASGIAFERCLSTADEGVKGFGLPAVDLALDFPWREQDTYRRIGFLAGRSVSEGHCPDFQRSSWRELAIKMATMCVSLIGFGPRCVCYEQMGKTPGSKYTCLDNQMPGALFREYLVDYFKDFHARYRFIHAENRSANVKTN